MLYLYSFVYNIPDDGFTEARTGRKDIVNDKRLIITGCEICWIKYYISDLLHAMWITLNTITLPPAPLEACSVLKTP